MPAQPWTHLLALLHTAGKVDDSKDPPPKDVIEKERLTEFAHEKDLNKQK